MSKRVKEVNIFYLFNPFNYFTPLTHPKSIAAT